MKKIIPYLLVILWAPGAIGHIGIGDSLSSGSDDWCHYLNTQGYHYKCLAQGGRTAVAFTLPSDLLPLEGHTVAVYWLLTNDASFWDHSEQAQNAVKAAAHSQLAQLLNAGFKVVVVLPPEVPCYDTTGPRTWLSQWTAVAAAHFRRPVRVIDPNKFDFVNNRVDCLHPTPEWSQFFAYHLHQFITNWEAE